MFLLSRMITVFEAGPESARLAICKLMQNGSAPKNLPFSSEFVISRRESFLHEHFHHLSVDEWVAAMQKKSIEVLSYIFSACFCTLLFVFPTSITSVSSCSSVLFITLITDKRGLDRAFSRPESQCGKWRFSGCFLPEICIFSRQTESLFVVFIRYFWYQSFSVCFSTFQDFCSLSMNEKKPFGNRKQFEYQPFWRD